MGPGPPSESQSAWRQAGCTDEEVALREMIPELGAEASVAAAAASAARTAAAAGGVDDAKRLVVHEQALDS